MYEEKNAKKMGSHQAGWKKFKTRPLLHEPLLLDREAVATLPPAWVPSEFTDMKRRICKKWWALFGTPVKNEGYYLQRLHEKRGGLTIEQFIKKILS